VQGRCREDRARCSRRRSIPEHRANIWRTCGGVWRQSFRCLGVGDYADVPRATGRDQRAGAVGGGSCRDCRGYSSRTSDDPRSGISTHCRRVINFREGPQRDQFVDHARARPNYGFSVAAHVPRQSQARREIIVIALGNRRDLDTFLDDALCWIEASQVSCSNRGEWWLRS